MTEDGLFDGTVSTRLEDFYIEPVSRYVKQNTSAPHFHSIVYRSSDVYSPQLAQPCASQLLHLSNNAPPEIAEDLSASAHLKGTDLRNDGAERSNDNWISNVDKVYGRSNKLTDGDRTRGSGLDPVSRSHRKNRSRRWSSDEVTQPTDSSHHITAPRESSRLDTYYYNPSVFYEFPNGSMSSTGTPDEVSSVRHVHKRATIDPKKTTCMLYLQADHLFYQKYGTEEACIEVMTRHVQRVNSIYKATGKLR